jgi:hypothetical protein
LVILGRREGECKQNKTKNSSDIGMAIETIWTLHSTKLRSVTGHYFIIHISLDLKIHNVI